MFERFTRSAQEAVAMAQMEARALGHDSIGAEHLLLAVAAGPSDAARVLADNGATPEKLREAVREEAASAAAGPPIDGEALAAIGIDLQEVRRRTDAAFGEGALERSRPRRRGRRASFAPFSPAAKHSLELALREALRLGDRHIGPQHVLLGVLREGSAGAVLERAGVSLDAVRTALDPAESRRGRGA